MLRYALSMEHQVPGTVHFTTPRPASPPTLQVTMTRLEGLQATSTLPHTPGAPPPAPMHGGGVGSGNKAARGQGAPCGQLDPLGVGSLGGGGRRGAVWRDCPAVHFPYAILEVKLQDEDSCPPWLQV